MWRLIANKLKENFGISTSPSQCENRWRVVERNYKKFVDNKNQTGAGRREFEYLGPMEEILDERTLIQSILRQTNVVKYMVSDVLQEIKQINKISYVPPEQLSQTLATRIKDAVELPLDNTESFEKFNEALNETTLYNFAVNDLAKLGGKSINDFIKRACLTLLTHKVGAEYSYYGKKGKKPFLKLNVAKVLIEAFLRYPDATTKIVSDLNILRPLLNPTLPATEDENDSDGYEDFPPLPTIAEVATRKPPPHQPLLLSLGLGPAPGQRESGNPLNPSPNRKPPPT
ncbi:unnamed protein product [Diabrotica balteata]|uniref:Myb-like domain-containing protein n=1 Tax=Diabrotica balteata TaxID=107213 RepID=A0A9N9XIJ2_DIABA|nr:unnamed protein product [Diabrotica balteata]